MRTTEAIAAIANNKGATASRTTLSRRFMAAMLIRQRGGWLSGNTGEGLGTGDWGLGTGDWGLGTGDWGSVA
ncbi:hypothetical protein GCM10027046_15500 [Uliginosibacterium flavum]